MGVLGIGILFVGGIIIGTVIDFIIKNGERDKGQKEPRQAVDTEILSGVVTEIKPDHDTGLTRITVMDSRGNVRYGFSSIPAEQLKPVYMGKGHMQVPIIRKPSK